MSTDTELNGKQMATPPPLTPLRAAQTLISSSFFFCGKQTNIRADDIFSDKCFLSTRSTSIGLDSLYQTIISDIKDICFETTKEFI